jgi:preprotein translocase subunit SecA
LEDDLMRMFGSERIAKVMDFAGYKEGEVIQHSMITKSIERAQKKVEENNFGVRKRLLEYDDVMNKQRTVIYKKRNHALFGERLALDLDNAFYQVIENLSFNHKTNNDFEGLKLALIVQVGLDTKITKEEFAAAKENDLAESLYQEAVAHYEYKKKDMMQNSIPVFKNIRTQEGKHIENVIVPVSDGKTIFNVLVNLDKNLDTKGATLATEFEKSISLSLIDDAWKEHLRAMDDLKQSVQTATYEQKDPLVIYKMEAFELFRKMDIEINHKMVQFLCHAHIPLEANEVKEGRQQKTDLSKLSANRTEDGTPTENEYHDPSTPKQAPITVGPKIGRNDPCPCGSGKKYKACHGKDAA